MIRNQRVFFFSFQDIESFDLEDFKYNFVNITSFRIVDAEDMSVREVLKDMEQVLNKSKGIQVNSFPILWHADYTRLKLWAKLT